MAKYALEKKDYTIFVYNTRYNQISTWTPGTFKEIIPAINDFILDGYLPLTDQSAQVLKMVNPLIDTDLLEESLASWEVFDSESIDYCGYFTWCEKYKKWD